MKTHLVRVVLVTAICCVPQTSHAQDGRSERPVSFGFMLGTAPLAGGDFSGSTFGSGYAVAIALTFPLPSPRLAIRADLMYRGAFSQGCFVNLVQPVSGRSVDPCTGPSQAMPLSADLQVRLNPRSTRWSPYLLAGGGVYLAIPSVESPGRSGRAGLQGGVGFEYRFSRHATWFIEGRYMQYGPGGMVPMTFGMRF